MMVGQANVNDRSTRPSGHVVNIEHVMTHDNDIERTSVPVRSSCRQNKQTVAGEQVDELSSVGVAAALQPDVKITDNVDRVLKRRNLVKICSICLKL